MSSESYDEPLALVIISSISIGVAAVVAIWIALDICIRRGWRSMMLIMIPVYIVNATYLWPITLWTYLKYGRPSQPVKSTHQEHNSHTDHAMQDTEKEGGHDMHHMHHGTDRPMFATVTIGVCHCGAGCVLGDIVGEWLVYGMNATIGAPPRLLWTAFLVDFGFAFAFGVVFQYCSIAPMAGEYGPKVLIRALKADALSLLFFQVGLFGWMAAYQAGIFQWRLETNMVTYWWMMQIGMFIGHWTSVPINYWLIQKGIKEPCA